MFVEKGVLHFMSNGILLLDSYSMFYTLVTVKAAPMRRNENRLNGRIFRALEGNDTIMKENKGKCQLLKN